MTSPDPSGHGTSANRMWGGRFSGSPDARLQAFGASLPVDVRMWREDIAGSRAHARMLASIGILSEQDFQAIDSGLDAVAQEFADGTIELSIEDEDIHMAIESRLTELIGDAGKRLHTGRSRNDQVATDTRLIVKRLASEARKLVLDLAEALLTRAEADLSTILPGYTHLQRAQPVLLAHHLLAYFWMFIRDAERFDAAHRSADVSPLGAAALAGTTYPLDRGMTADELGFAGVIPNSMDAVSDRDYILDTTYAAALTQIHLSRLAEELVTWSSGEFGFITMADTYSTGSSIMPQKKNPDFAELIRGKSGRVVGDLVSLLVTLKSLPLTYSKDLQEDKEGMFDAVDTVMHSTDIMRGMIETLTVNSDAMGRAAQGGFMAATDLADHLVTNGVPFREAHSVIGSLVKRCEDEGVTLQDLTLDELKAHDCRFGDDALDAVDIEKVVARRTTQGGTGHEAVEQQILVARQRLIALRGDEA